MFAEEFLAYENFDGLIIEGFGLGQIPFEKIGHIKKIPFEILEKINYFVNITLHYHTHEKMKLY